MSISNISMNELHKSQFPNFLKPLKAGKQNFETFNQALANTMSPGIQGNQHEIDGPGGTNGSLSPEIQNNHHEIDGPGGKKGSLSPEIQDNQHEIDGPGGINKNLSPEIQDNLHEIDGHNRVLQYNNQSMQFSKTAYAKMFSYPIHGLRDIWSF